MTRAILCRGILLASLLLSFATAAVCADNQSERGVFNGLKARYSTLRNTDPEISRESEWKALSAQFQALAKTEPGSAEGANCLFHAALLDIERYLVLKDERAGEEATELLTQIGEVAPSSPVADEALLKLGDLLSEQGEQRKAKRAYARLQELYPDSELSAVAAARLRDGYAPRSRNENADNTAQQAGNGPRIVIDPGHGGEDLGAQGVGGLLEKDVTLAVALELAEILTAKSSATVKLTRKQDIFVPLAERTTLANDFDADIFISLHANASPGAKLTGLETYILDNADDKATRLLAERENASLKFEGEGSDLQFILSDLVQSSKLGESKTLASDIQGAILSSLDNGFTRPKDLGVKKAPFYVLVGAHMPSVLVELAFIDNATEGKSLADKGYRRALAEGLAAGVLSYLRRGNK
jgi:N-acetylmuramoyl-L-alanine amidase